MEEIWRTNLQTLEDRTNFIFNNGLLSDVKFVVPLSSQSETKKAIPVHKFVLAINSPVFLAMFCGQMMETTDSIALPDCEYEGLLEFFRFLYNKNAYLSETNVMQVLYLAHKYMVPSLFEYCTDYLGQILTASNAFWILAHAQIFGSKSLEDKCWEKIVNCTKEALASPDFVAVEWSVVESVVKKDVLNVKEVELFKAANRWATKKCEKEIPIAPSDGEKKRRILGDEIVKAIRFPLMSEEEFTSEVVNSHILTDREVNDMIQHYRGVLKSPLPFMESARVKIDRCNRFRHFNAPFSGSDNLFSSSDYSVEDRSPRNVWLYNGADADSVNFTVNNPIMLHGVQHFGSERGKYTVSTEVKDITHNSCLGEKSGTYISEKEDRNNYYGFDVLFDRPVSLEANKQYMLKSVIEGPLSWYGADGQTSAESGGVQFSFSSSDNADSNGTSVEMGQFPVIIFS